METKPKAIILSGGPNSVHVEGSPRVPNGFFDYCTTHGIPVLGVCYGMQMIVHLLGGEVKAATEGGEYGKMEIHTEVESVLFRSEPESHQVVWMSHGDEAVRLPEGFKAVARSAQGAIVAVENPGRKIYGLQYHPGEWHHFPPPSLLQGALLGEPPPFLLPAAEVVHSVRGKETIARFLHDLCGLKSDWKMENVLELELAKIRAQVGPNDHAICALSGGVDSTVAATLVHKVLGDRLHCVFVDNGLLRYKERERVDAVFKEALHLPVTTVDATERFMAKLKGLTDPEAKRKTIGAEFIAVFRDFAAEQEKKLGIKPKFLVQGTLYPDVIESCPPPGKGQKHSHTIKSHHNVGGLPKDLGFELIEPLRELFKDEVRSLGRLMGVPETFITRHPFPGPGLAVRVLGDVTDSNKLDTLRLVDEIFINEIKAAGLYDEIWQAFAVFLPLRSVGVQGDQRTHSHVVALRAVTSSDGMTADWYPFTPQFLRQVSTKICNQVRAVNRVCYDITSKPPCEQTTWWPTGWVLPLHVYRTALSSLLS